LGSAAAALAAGVASAALALVGLLLGLEAAATVVQNEAHGLHEALGPLAELGLRLLYLAPQGLLELLPEQHHQLVVTLWHLKSWAHAANGGSQAQHINNDHNKHAHANTKDRFTHLTVLLVLQASRHCGPIYRASLNFELKGAQCCSTSQEATPENESRALQQLRLCLGLPLEA
jgi:hypothetical protein